MPFPPNGPNPPQMPVSPGLLPLRGLTLLVVEDSRFACDVLRLICGRSGARLRRAETLAGARAFLANHHPDVVIVDLGLPDGRGEDLIADLAARGLPVLGTSGDPEGRGPALASGAGGFLDKPIPSVAAFQHLILDLLGVAGDVHCPTPDAPAADPLAFHDDLARASGLIAGADSSYATGFLRGLGRAAGDRALEDAALGASTDLGRAALLRLVATRLALPQPVS